MTRSGLLFAETGMSTSPQALPRCRKKSRHDIVRRVQGFNTFTPDNDPYFEHDFGSFEHAGKMVFWKLDYYDRERRYGLPDPADERVTERILTVMLAEEY